MPFISSCLQMVLHTGASLMHFLRVSSWLYFIYIHTYIYGPLIHQELFGVPFHSHWIPSFFKQATPPIFTSFSWFVLFVIFYATLHLVRVVCMNLVCGGCCWLEHGQLHSGYSTGESDFSSSTNGSLPLAPQTGPEHREPLSCLWCNVDGFILCQSHADNQSCQTVLQLYYILIRAFHSTPPHSPPLLSFSLPPSTIL